MMWTHTFHAMGCQMAAWVISDDPRAQAALIQVEQWMHRVEQALSRFRPDSDLSRLNAAAGRPYRAGPILWEVTQKALAMAQATQGLFDPTIGQALIQAGYDRTFTELAHSSHDDAQTFQALEPSGASSGAWQGVQLDPQEHTILLPPHTRLDLGGIAKGWAADQALALLRPWGPALVDAGGDLAIGDPPPDQDGWPLAVMDPLDPESDLVFLHLANQGLATSGTDHRRWRSRGRWHHHLIHPQQGRPAETDILTATVIAETAMEADVWASDLVIMGSAQADQWLHQHPHLSALLVQYDGNTLHTPAFSRQAVAYFPRYHPSG